MRKVFRVGTIASFRGSKSRYSVYIVFDDTRDYVSFTGVEGPLPSGNCRGGCGQIDMGYKHRNGCDDDARYNPEYLKRAADFNFAPGWNVKKWLDLLELWKKYHLKKPADLPQYGRDFLAGLPETDKHPAWC
jgi:hypothetical protein